MKLENVRQFSVDRFYTDECHTFNYSRLKFQFRLHKIPYLGIVCHSVIGSFKLQHEEINASFNRIHNEKIKIHSYIYLHLWLLECEPLPYVLCVHLILLGAPSFLSMVLYRTLTLIYDASIFLIIVDVC